MNNTMKCVIPIIKAAVLIFTLSAGSALAQADAPLADGEIRRIDRDAQKITIRHGPIPNLNMPAMSMVFQVSDSALLDRAKTGDKVKFSAVLERGSYVVNHIEIRDSP